MGTRVKYSYLGGLRYYDLCKEDRIFLKIYPHNDILKTNVVLSGLLLDLNAKWTWNDVDIILLSPVSIFNPDSRKLRDGLLNISSSNPLSFYPVLLDESGFYVNIGPGCLPENYVLGEVDEMLGGSNLYKKRLVPGKEPVLEYFKLFEHATHRSELVEEISYLYHIGAFDEFSKDIKDEIWNTLEEKIKGTAFRGKSFKFLY